MTREPLYLMAIILPPLLCYVLFTSLMAAGLPTRLPAAVVDMDGSSTSRAMVRNLGAFQHTDIVAHYPSAHEAFDAMRRGEVYGFYLIPQGTEAEVMTGESPLVSFYLNYAYLIAGSLLYEDMRTLSELTDAGIGMQLLYAHGAASWQVEAVLQPIALETHPLHNPWLNYSVYLNNTLMPGVLALMVLLVTVYSIGTEVKHGTVRQWLAMSNGHILPAMVGKMLPQTTLFILMALLGNAWLYGYLHFPLEGGVWPMLMASTLLVLASQGLGVILFCLFPWMRMAMSAAALWGVISFSISGFSFPAMGMSADLQALNHLFPLRHYFLISTHSALNGYPIHDTAGAYVALSLFSLLPLLCLKRLRRVMLTYKYME